MTNKSTASIILDNEEKQKFLTSENNITACIIIIENACRQYQAKFGKLNVPFSYIKFFFKELDKYSALFDIKLRQFYTQANALKIEPEDMVNCYTRSFFSTHTSMRTSKEDKFLCFDSIVPTTFSNEMRAVTNTSASSYVESLLNVCKKIDNADELPTQKELYEKFMIEQVVLSYNFSHKKPKKEDKPKSQKEQTTVAPTEEDKEPESKLLVGNRLDDNYQNSGKITKIVIPKLDLPTEYPSINNSRIVRFVHIASICTPAKEIVFINRHKIVAIKYSSKFIDKRKPQKQKSKFNWDF